MKKLQYIYSPRHWKLIEEKTSELLTDDVIYEMIIGEWIDYSQGNIVSDISKINYEKILKREYIVRIQPYEVDKILLFDQEGREVPLVNGIEIEKTKTFVKNRKS